MTETDLKYIEARVRVLESKPYLSSQDQTELDELQKRLKKYMSPSAKKTEEEDMRAPIWNQPRPVLHGKKGKKLNKYQIFISECRRGYGQFDGEGKKGFEECVEAWRQVKQKE